MQLYTYRVCGYAMMFTLCYVRAQSLKLPPAVEGGGRVPSEVSAPLKFFDEYLA